MRSDAKKKQLRSKSRRPVALSAWRFENVPAARSRNMAAIRSRDTKPERIVRSMAHRMGYRFRLHRRGLPGCPDLVFPKYHSVIFVHGCFWHRHHCRVGRRSPKTNAVYWQAKRERNQQRDRRNRRALLRAGWTVLTIWECQIRDPTTLASRLSGFLR